MIFCLVILLEEVDVKILPNAVYLILRLLDLCTCNNRTVQAHGYTILHTYSEGATEPPRFMSNRGQIASEMSLMDTCA
ncbi:uncharacterized protein LOC105692665 isoform X3 [Athalia rosae]|uniref:uncharacterized protein LOC105692665 isoform X3 n=1 Tax=Athalia rosae TaxID=37344 RepID=UPI00203406D5|nr:uncharacterized protein LOC105692665 isoform X3 [Athalia rosae]